MTQNDDPVIRAVASSLAVAQEEARRAGWIAGATAFLDYLNAQGYTVTAVSA